jgi:2-polyprenyl-3-methyl-5-hydroxy-6-metoxy-1,4-benzoquinol methylase
MISTNKKVNCLLCNATAKLMEENYPGYKEPDTFRIHYCSHCNTSFSLPRVETGKIYELIYQYGDKVFGYDRYWKYYECCKNSTTPLQYLVKEEEMYWAVENALKEFDVPKKKLRLLEVGCGLGYLTYALMKDGYNAKGLDISQNAINEATEAYGNHYICADVVEYAKHNKKLYDAIILTEVIEHIEEPVTFLESLIDLLSERGKIILTTPNKTIFPETVFWNTDLPPVHIWWFSENSMRYIANKINANIRFIDFSDYYKEKRNFVVVKEQKSIREISHIFSMDGKIINQINNVKQNNKLRSIIVKVPYMKRIYNKLNPNRNVCGRRGYILGVVLNIN